MTGNCEKETLAIRLAEVPERIMQKHPLVHMIPNTVTVALCTDGLSALGARPLMAVAPEEMEEIPSYADAVVINMGQPGREKIQAARLALTTAARCSVPIVWDPVGAGASGFRRQEFLRLLDLKWTGIVKGNRSEIATLQSGCVSHQGIDSIGEFRLNTRARDGRVWAVSGEQDLVFNGNACFSLHHEGQNKMMLTGSGCLTGAVMGACYAVEKDPAAAALAAFLIMSYAGEKASSVRGYGSQKCALLDALTAIDYQEFEQYVRKAVTASVKTEWSDER
ncbi:MAG: hydroxyethylthiazole kinase [Candidatus Choladocola sp.]|nr:hydroxyethylthiazole kinase [Candidatus Choladocola sp.]